MKFASAVPEDAFSLLSWISLNLSRTDADDTSANLDENPSTTFEPQVGAQEAPLSVPETATFPETSVPASTPDFELESAAASPGVPASPSPLPAVSASPTPGKSESPVPGVLESPAPGKSVTPSPAVQASPVPLTAVTPLPSPSRRFEDRINQGIRQCRGETGLPFCSWRNGRIIISQGLVVEEQISDGLCCCTCHQVDECQAIHYKRREGRCVFHQGPIRRDRRQGGMRRWRKQ